MWDEFVEILKKHAKEDAGIDLVDVTFGDVSQNVIVHTRDDNYGLIFPLEWKDKDLSGLNLDELASSLTFVPGIRLKDLLYL